MAEKTFSVVYDGPVLETGAMPVRDLAPALLALGEIFTTASLVEFPTREPVALHIRATHQGSFDVELLLATKRAFDEAVDIFDSNPMHALEGLVLAVTSGKAGLFWLINKIRGRRVVDESPAPEPGHVILTLDDGTTIDVPTAVVILYNNGEVRRRAKEVVEPLRREGVEAVSFRIDGEPGARVEESDLAAYEVIPVDEEKLLDVVQNMVLEIVSVTFTEGNKWGFSDGDRKFTAPIEDDEFIARVNAGEAFSKGDALRCEVRVIQSRVDKRLQIERRVVRVVEHYRALDAQLDLGDVA